MIYLYKNNIRKKDKITYWIYEKYNKKKIIEQKGIVIKKKKNINCNIRIIVKLGKYKYIKNIKTYSSNFLYYSIN
ncbi:hypothetical protein [Candidatus Vidania fulgoroideorum]